MIDTVKFKIPLSEEQFNLILKKSHEIVKTNNQNNIVEFRIVNNDIEIGSYDRKITIRIFDTQHANVELSLPKFYLGNNVELLYPSQVEMALQRLQDCLQDHYGDFPPYMNWSLERLDLCYAWRYQDQQTAVRALSVLKTFDYPRKSKYLYKDSVMWRGRHFSLKFYLKLPEFVQHDFHQLNRAGKHDFANRIFALSEGVLRFEITMRKEQLKDLWGKKILTYKELLDKENLEHILGEYLNRLLINLDKSVMDDEQVLSKIRLAGFRNRRIIDLFAYYKLCVSPKLNFKQIYKDHYNPSTIWRYKRDLKNAGVGLPQLDLPINFSLDIPSEQVVNTDLSNPRVSEDA